MALGNSLEEYRTVGFVYGGDHNVYVNDKTILYPDISVSDGPAQVDQRDALHNPVVIVEILSSSTAKFDRGRKFELYKSISSLQHYVLVDQYRVAVTHFAKNADNNWAIVGEYLRLDDALTMTIEGKEIAVPLAAIYRRMPLVVLHPRN